MQQSGIDLLELISGEVSYHPCSLPLQGSKSLLVPLLAAVEEYAFSDIQCDAGINCEMRFWAPHCLFVFIFVLLSSTISLYDVAFNSRSCSLESTVLSTYHKRKPLGLNGLYQVFG